MDSGAAKKGVILTAGHSTRPLEEFIGLLASNGVEVAADVRSYPSSKRFPWFGRERLAAALEGAGIEYAWLKDLGGRRRSRSVRPAGDRAERTSPHTALPEGAFRNYADAMESRPFLEAAALLEDLARMRRVLLFCAEKDPHRCHRRFLSDFLAVRGYEIVHLIDEATRRPHSLHPDLVVGEGRLLYTGGQGRLPFGT